MKPIKEMRLRPKVVSLSDVYANRGDPWLTEKERASLFKEAKPPKSKIIPGEHLDKIKRIHILNRMNQGVTKGFGGR